VGLKRLTLEGERRKRVFVEWLKKLTRAGEFLKLINHVI